MSTADEQTLTFATPQQWEAWLSKHYTQQDGVIIKIAKKDTGVASVTHQEALDIALCYGWIDAIRRSFDATYFLQRFTPRRPRSLWSKVNIGKVEALIAAGRMQAPGMAEIEKAKADGRWAAAYEPAATATIPDDLADYFKAHPKAAAYYESLNKTNKYAVIWRLATARTPETRAKRFVAITAMLEAGESFH